MSLSHKILLYKSVLKPIRLSEYQVCDLAVNSNLLPVQVVQNKTLRSIIKFPWYIRNNTIHRDKKVDPIRTSIKKLSTKFFENLCMAVVGGFALPHFFLLLLNPNLLVPPWLFTLSRVSKSSRSICCRG